jgi:hypothetical protein
MLGLNVLSQVVVVGECLGAVLAAVGSDFVVHLQSECASETVRDRVKTRETTPSSVWHEGTSGTYAKCV